MPNAGARRLRHGALADADLPKTVTSGFTPTDYEEIERKLMVLRTSLEAAGELQASDTPPGRGLAYPFSCALRVTYGPPQ